MPRTSRSAPAERDALAEWGIERVPADHYLVNGFRYTNLADAMAEARRARSR
jgi:hypothetical protein